MYFTKDSLLQILRYVFNSIKYSNCINKLFKSLTIKQPYYLQALQAEMSAPTQFKGRLNELLSQVRLQSQASAMSGGGEKYNMDPFLISDIRALLKQQQDGLQVNQPFCVLLILLCKQSLTYFVAAVLIEFCVRC